MNNLRVLVSALVLIAGFWQSSSTVLPAADPNCVQTVDDCTGRFAGDYAFCADCTKYATCAGSGFYVRQCPEISVFDPTIDKCADYNIHACKRV